jgi:hypothetical protein
MNIFITVTLGNGKVESFFVKKVVVGDRTIPLKTLLAFRGETDSKLLNDAFTTIEQITVEEIE